MKIFRNVIYSFFLLFSSLFADIDPDGWVPLPRPQQRHFEDEGEEDDPSLWVVFSKTFDGEKILVRLPEDPEYVESDGTSLEVTAKTETEDHILRITKEEFENGAKMRLEEISQNPKCLLVQVERPSSHILDILYRNEGKWVQERIQKSPGHLYVFQTVSETLEGAGHRQFIGSLNFEPLSMKNPPKTLNAL